MKTYLVYAVFLGPLLPGQLVCPSSIISEGLAHKLITPLRNAHWLAHTLTFPKPQFRVVLVDQVRQPMHGITALLGRPFRPFTFEGRTGSGNGSIDVR